MKYDPQDFRDKYRADIGKYYNAYLHGSFVLVFGIACLGYYISRMHNIEPLEWLVIPAAYLFFNWGEYQIHKNWGHTKTRYAAMFYKRHTGDHHSFFSSDRMHFETMQDWRVILFPPALIVVFAVGALSSVWLIGKLLSENAGWLFAATLLVGYLMYEIFHATQHLPATNPVTRLPGIRYMRRHHALHHRRDLMQRYNFNLVIPLTDFLYGTWYRGGIAEKDASAEAVRNDL